MIPIPNVTLSILRQLTNNSTSFGAKSSDYHQSVFSIVYGNTSLEVITLLYYVSIHLKAITLCC